jgi:DNA-binding protein HU-beta
MPTHKSHEQEGVLHDAARSIGTALGNLSAKAGELTDSITDTAKSIHMPSLPSAHEAKVGAQHAMEGAKNAVTSLLTRKKKKVVKKAAAKKAAVKKAAKKAVKKVVAKVNKVKAKVTAKPKAKKKK